MHFLSRYQRIAEKLFPVGTHRYYYYELALIGIRVLLNEGWRSFWRRLIAWLRRRLEPKIYGNKFIISILPPSVRERLLPSISDYIQWLENSRITPLARRFIEAHIARFTYRPKFSIVMPVFNPPLRFLHEAIKSAQAQVYPDWELCICDNGSEPHIKSLLKSCAGKDPRLKLTTHAQNLGVSEGTNAALRIAQGEFIVLLDHDDVLDPTALYYLAKALNEDPSIDVLYSDRDHIDEKNVRHDPYFKPDFSPHTILSHNYIIHLLAFRAALLDRVGLFRKETDGSQDYDMILRLTEVTDRIVHIPRVLYSWRKHAQSASIAPVKPYAYDAAVKAIRDALVRRGQTTATVAKAEPTGSYRVTYQFSEEPLVSIIISAWDVQPFLERCVTSLKAKSTYRNKEIIVVTNNPNPHALSDFCHKHGIQLCTCPLDSFFSLMNNHAARVAKGDYLLFLNDDTEVLTAQWIENMLDICQLPEVGAVGPLLLMPNGEIQFTYAVAFLDRDGSFYFFCPHALFATPRFHGFSADVISDVSAVSGACMMVKSRLFELVGGFDAVNFPLAFQDIDLCFRFLDLGLNNIYTPYAKLVHLGAGTKKKLPDFDFDNYIYKPDLADARRFCTKHATRLRSGDRYFNKNLCGIGAFRSPPPFLSDDQLAVQAYDEQYWTRYGYPLMDEGEATTQRKQRVETLFKPLASKIIAATGCQKVIDIGCGLGELVEAFRALGVHAVGVESSPVAFRYMPDTLLPFVIQCSVTDPGFHDVLSKQHDTRYDVASAIELLEHLPERKIDLALEHICSLSDTIVITTPSPNLWDCSDPTHLLVRPLQYWEKKFSAHGFAPAPSLTRSIFGILTGLDEDSTRLVFQKKK